MTRMPRRFAAAATALGMAAAIAPTNASAAELFYGVTNLNRLASFTSQAPGAILSRAAISGLQVNELVLTLDRRPETGELLATTNQGRLYVINPFNAGARLIGTPFPAPAATSVLGSDINPVADRLRVVDDADRNFKLNPSTGADNPDTALAYAAGDPGAGANPSVDAIAYTNATPGATSTELFAIDAGRDALTRLATPDSGSMTTVAGLGLDAQAPVNFDIAANGNAAFATFRTPGVIGTRLYSVNLTTGATTALSTRNLVRLSDPLVGLTSVGTVADDTTPPKTTVAAQRRVGSRYRTNVSCSESCEAKITLTIGSTEVGSLEFVMLQGNALRRDVLLTNAGRDLLAAPGLQNVTATFTASDQAGNTVTRKATTLS